MEETQKCKKCNKKIFKIFINEKKDLIIKCNNCSEILMTLKEKNGL